MAFITVKNPVNGQLGTMSERAYERVWKEKGYEKVADQPLHRMAGRDPSFTAEVRQEEPDEEPEETPTVTFDSDKDTETRSRSRAEKD